ncbi:MAG: riboflavin synthase [Gemmatimonadota bacterium]|jgi:riboflavin synthase
MFTGIIEATGTVSSVEELEGGRMIVISAPESVLEDLDVGDSVAVDGCCLTAVEVGTGTFRIEAIGTTLSRTIAGTYQAGSVVNLERAVRVGDRLDGHIVQGHVDGLGALVATVDQGEYRLMDFRISDEVERVTILHGSITINGISLTVNALPDRSVCQVGIIPHTWEVTNLSRLGPGDPVNLEGDLIGKYVGKLIAPRQDSP